MEKAGLSQSHAQAAVLNTTTFNVVQPKHWQSVQFMNEDNFNQHYRGFPNGKWQLDFSHWNVSMDGSCC